MRHKVFAFGPWLLLAMLIVGAARGGEPATRRIVCSTTQVADFARQVVGDRWRVDCLLAPGRDPHTYQIDPQDVRLVADADLCLENGWHLEGGDWMENLAKDANKPLVTCVTGLRPLSVEGGTDPHAWFTPRNAAVYVRNILRAVVDMDPEHAAEYQARTELYLRQLETLDVWIKKQVSRVPEAQRILVTSHDAFGYFCAAYKFKSAAPTGWSTGAEVGAGPTPARRKQAIDSIREFGVRAVFVETSVNKDLIFEIAKEANVIVGGELYSDSMGTPGSAGESYIGMMRENVLKITRGLAGE